MTLKEKTKNCFSSVKNKIISLRTNQLVLVCALLSIIYLISGYWKWIEIGVSLCALAFMAVMPVQNALCVFTFLHSFTLSNIGYDSCFMVTLIGFCLILLVKYWIGVKNNDYAYHKKLISLIGTFYIVGIILSLFKPLYNGAWLYFTYLPLAYFLFAMRKEFKIQQAMNFMFGGLLTSCSLAVLGLCFPKFQYLSFNIINDDYRFRAFVNNTNYLYMRALFLMSYYMFQHLNKKLSLSKFIIIYAACSIITISTLSKTGFAMLALLSLLYIILLLKQDFKKNIKFVGAIVLFGLLAIAVCHKFILAILQRFLNDFNSNNLITSLFTGRNEIWNIYLDQIFSSPIKALFGHGLLTQQLYVGVPYGFGNTETHNFYIWLLYRFGIVGTIALCYIIYRFIKLINKEKPKFIAYLPLLFILLESLFDNTMKCYHITYFLFAIMILFMDCKEKAQNEKIKS